MLQVERLANSDGARGLVAAMLIFFFHPGLASQPAVPADLLQRAAAYVTQFRHEFSGIVAEETYVQDIGRSPGSSVDVVSAAASPWSRIAS